ncbi:MAG: hypothetical protein VW644_00435, partial [Alphaproteobacteria bacterium]
MTQFDFVKTGKRLAAATLCAAALFATALPAAPETQAATITVQGNTTGVGNCIPFGCPGSYAPTMGFVYKNIPSFTLDIGDVIAFDTGGINDTVLS